MEQRGILLAALAVILLSQGGIALANRMTCAENKTRQEGMKDQLDLIENKLDQIMLK